VWNKDIPKWLENMNYVCLYVALSSDKWKKCGPGKEKWLSDLDKLTGEQRVALEERIERWERRVAS